MNIKQVGYYVETVEKGSLSAAAKELYVTVQAISKAVSNLESELGCDLLERNSRGVRPTAFGRAFYRKAVRAIDSFRELESFARTYRSFEDRSGHLRLGLNTPPFHGNEQMRENIAQFIESQIGVKTAVPLAQGDQGLVDLRAGRLDALITVGMFRHEDVVCEIIGTVAPAAMLHRGHPLAGKRVLSLGDIAPYPVANPRWFSDFSNTIASIYQERAPQLRFVDVDVTGFKAHLQDDDGVVITTGIEALGKMIDDIVLVPIAADDSIAVPICLVSLAGGMTPQLLRLQKLLLNGLTLFKHGKPAGGGSVGASLSIGI